VRCLERTGRLECESLVGSQDLVYPASELSDTGVDSGGGGRAAAASPGDDTDQGPHVVLLADQRATGVTLREQPHQIRVLRDACFIKVTDMLSSMQGQ
jgi:hypothetical protein